MLRFLIKLKVGGLSRDLVLQGCHSPLVLKAKSIPARAHMIEIYLGFALLIDIPNCGGGERIHSFLDKD
jgi:hypothetical protein